ncbi:UVB-resistance protein UVR8 homologue, putative [Plasmodium gallinaceum]|uniref:UVB-resistance protein UVR8 homologue, putative n=1 Tax=Plasmodium gallinaceum TaxID=5849 RepID=A0A1J1GVE2_PLAGA|nr:UVB-resistance protein UVR8 homologue, putative [Plasmodium gallinaceum]CRG96426.1 UVB-resistance protein UVR8 homologue, putative [Plasmodium gallinaceum]
MLKICKRLKEKNFYLKYDVKFFSNKTNVEEKEKKYNLWRWGCTGDSIFSSVKVGEKNKLPEKISNFENSNIEKLSAGCNHAAFIVDGKIFTYGLNDKGQLGRQLDENEKQKNYSLIPKEVNISNNVKFKNVCCGFKHTLAIDENNDLYSWGWGGNFFKGANGLGQGNKENIIYPKKVESFKNEDTEFVDICCGDQHSLVLTKNGKVYGCGRGEFGRLGRGNHGDQLFFEEIEFFTSNNIIIKNICCGHSFSAALSVNGELYVWGRNDYGQLGIENSIGDLYSHEVYPNKVKYFEIENVKIKLIACGDNHMIACSENNIIYFWGARAWLEPKAITLNPKYENSVIKSDIEKIDAGGSSYYYSMLLSDNKLYSWGKHNSSCLALGDKKNHNEPTLVDSKLFNDEKVCDISCGRGRVLAKTLANN